MRLPALLLLLPLAIGALGVLVMLRHGASTSQVSLQLAALATGCVLSVLLTMLGRERLQVVAPWGALLSLALLLVTLLGEGLLGVRRWLVLGPVRLHVSSLASPLILVGAAALLATRPWGYALLLLAAAQACHAVQPDAGQASAMAAGALALLVSQETRPALRALGAAVLAASIAPALMQTDPLPAVPLVEGIVGLAGNLGRPFQVLAMASLTLLPVAIAWCIRRVAADDLFARSVVWGMAAYVAGILLAPVWGNFPVPLMGFGASPALGVAICVGATAALRGR